MKAASVIILAAALLDPAASAQARSRNHDGGVPNLDVEGSCQDAQKFSSDDKNMAYKGCMQDESNAKAELVKKWSSFKPRDRRNCVEQARFPSPSYVEILTCMELDVDATGHAGRIDGKPVPQIGGAVAPGLAGTPEK